MTRAVVFAYHNVGVRCLSALLAHRIEVALVLTHDDDPAELIWFDSVRDLAQQHGIPTIAPRDPHAPDVVAQLRAAEPDFLFSFYYRHMLKPPLLGIAPRGALNMHGSLLPKYRGRVPVNWAVIKGETETGATLHYMVEKPDAGDIVDQQRVAILPDDTALDVFGKVTAAAGAVVDRSVPRLVEGNAPRIPQNLALGSYFGGRRPEDGRIDWTRPAAEIHNLVRGVAPPYPGAFTELAGRKLRILRTRVAREQRQVSGPPAIYVSGENCFASCAHGSTLQILAMELDGAALRPQDFRSRFGSKAVFTKASAR